MKLSGDDPLDLRPRRLPPARRGSIVLAIELLARALAEDDYGSVRLAQLQLGATFAPEACTGHIDPDDDLLKHDGATCPVHEL